MGTTPSTAPSRDPRWCCTGENAECTVPVCPKMAPIGRHEVFEAVQVYPDGMHGDATLRAGIYGVDDFAERDDDLDAREDPDGVDLHQSQGPDGSKQRTSVHFGSVDPESPHGNGNGASRVIAPPYESEGSKPHSYRLQDGIDRDSPRTLFESVQGTQSGPLYLSATASTHNGQSTGTAPIRPPSPPNVKRPKPVLKRSVTDSTGTKLNHFSGSSIAVSVDDPTPSTPSGHPGAKLSRRGTGELQSHSGSEPREPHPFQQGHSKSRLVSGGSSNMNSDSSDFGESVSQDTESDFDVYEYNQPEYEVTLLEEHGPLGVRVVAFRSHMLMVAEIFADGAIPRWNARHPEKQVRVGDAILEITGSSPRERIGRASVRALEKYFTVSAPEDGEHFTAWMKLRHDAFELYLGPSLTGEVGLKLPLGVTLEAVDDGRLLKVKEVEEGLVQEWNVEAMAWHLSLVPGDIILEVNGQPGTAKEMLKLIKKSTHAYHLKVVHVNKAGQRILTRVESGNDSGTPPAVP
mmetsp:Transcript_13550/g.30865  ORF Transcript_13550/g.30865 Transcript_13550/m.30865 type:complete len:518 (-) Transcript_13550:82-1635(-)